MASTLNDLGGNLINTSASPTVVNPNLSPLGNYGGPTQTMLPQPGSAAICGGLASNIPAGVTTDQRGYPIENTTYPGYSSVDALRRFGRRANQLRPGLHYPASRERDCRRGNCSRTGGDAD